jgi:hypothetical protein
MDVDDVKADSWFKAKMAEWMPVWFKEATTEREMSKEASDIRSRDGGGGGGGGGGRGREEKFEEGDNVEANYKGKGKYYPGKISRARLNGTYDIAYDDGERESNVSSDFVRAVDAGVRSSRGGQVRTLGTSHGGSSSSGRGRTQKYAEMDRVEANYKGKGKYYPGKISRARLNGTYDIAYDDGERETGMSAENIRSR